MKVLSAEEIIQQVIRAASNKKAQKMVMLNVHSLTAFADYFLICSGRSTSQVQAIVQGIKECADKEQIPIHRIEGFKTARWVLMDLGDVIVHVFHYEEREFYNLEKLWGDAESVEFQEFDEQ